MASTNNNELEFNAMVNTVEQLSQGKTCLNCGGDMFIQTGVCPYCGKQIVNIEAASKSLDQILLSVKNKGLELDELTIALYAIKEQFPEVEELMIQNNIEEKLNKRLDAINLKIANGEVLESSDDVFLRNCLFNDIKPKNDLNDISIFRNIFSNNEEKMISYETFEQVMKSFIKDMMREFNNNRIKRYNPVCSIYDFKMSNNENSDGMVSKGFIIRINNKITKEIYEHNYIQDFIAIFHELIHTQQAIEIRLGYFTEDILLFIKDDILRELSSKEGFDYYWENYQFITSEKDAEIKGCMCAINFLEQVIGIRLKNDIVDDLEKRINVQLAEKSKLLRKTNNGEQDVNTLFDYYIKNHPEFLEKYPQLTIEYIVSDGIVRRKQNDELLETIKYYQNQPVIISYINKILSSQAELNNNINSHK